MSFSQNVTQDTTKVLVPKTMMYEIAKDLIRGDAAQEEVSLLGSKVSLLETKSTYQDSLIAGLNKNISVLKEAILTSHEQLEISSELTNKLTSSIKKEKRKNKIMTFAGGGLLVAALGILILQ